MSDIQKYGSTEGVGFYWVRVNPQWGPPWLVLVAIDELGNVTETEVRGEYDEAASTEREAVIEHLGAGAVKHADSHLERRRRKLKDNPPPPKPTPMDPATAKFFSDGGY